MRQAVLIRQIMFSLPRFARQFPRSTKAKLLNVMACSPAWSSPSLPWTGILLCLLRAELSAMTLGRSGGSPSCACPACKDRFPSRATIPAILAINPHLARAQLGSRLPSKAFPACRFRYIQPACRPCNRPARITRHRPPQDIRPLPFGSQPCPLLNPLLKPETQPAETGRRPSPEPPGIRAASDRQRWCSPTVTPCPEFR